MNEIIVRIPQAQGESILFSTDDEYYEITYCDVPDHEIEAYLADIDHAMELMDLEAEVTVVSLGR